MYLKSLRLENIACFEELDLDFTDENGEPCKWVVLLGENGMGKSTIIRLLAVGLMGEDNLDVVAGDMNWNSLMRAQEIDFENLNTGDGFIDIDEHFKNFKMQVNIAIKPLNSSETGMKSSTFLAGNFADFFPLLQPEFNVNADPPVDVIYDGNNNFNESHTGTFPGACSVTAWDTWASLRMPTSSVASA
uniref:AAA family ATPase n=1 Tax=Armatimonas sp. TaxID=1872638 RepID=UPI00375085FF